MKTILSPIQQWFKIYKKPFLQFLAIYLIAYSAIFLSGTNYGEEALRFNTHTQEWYTIGESFSSLLTNILFLSKSLYDIWPLPQILATIFLSLSSVLLLSILREKDEFHFFDIVAGSLLGLTPLFMQSMALRYESLMISLAIFLSILPLQWYKSEPQQFFILSTISVFASFLFDDHAMGVYLLVCSVLFLLRKNSFKNYSAGVIGYIVAFLLFYLITAPMYANHYPTLEIFHHYIPGLYLEIIRQVKVNFRNLWLLAMAIVLLTDIVLYLKKDYSSKSILKLVACFVVITISFGGSFLTNTIFPISISTLYIVNVCIASLAIAMLQLGAKQYIHVATFVLAYNFFIVNLIFGNALINQKHYSDFRTQQLIADLVQSDVLSTTTTKKIKITGNIGLAPQNREMFSIVKNSIPIIIYEPVDKLFPSKMTAYELLHFYDFGNFKLDNVINENDVLFDVVIDNIYETIYNSENAIVISFKENNAG